MKQWAYPPGDQIGETVLDRRLVWEPHVAYFIERWLRARPSRGAFVDIGAHIGVHSVHALRARCRQVVAIEPRAAYVACIESNLRRAASRASRSTVIRAAVGRERGEVAIAVNANNAGDAWVAPPDAGGVEVAPMAPLGELLETHGVTAGLDLVKIDVQGFEPAVLEGAAGLIEADRPTILLELEDDTLARTGSSSRAVVDWLRERGYEIVWLFHHYPSDHVCVHESVVPEFVELFKGSIRKNHFDNTVNHHRDLGVTEMLVFTAALFDRGALGPGGWRSWFRS